MYYLPRITSCTVAVLTFAQGVVAETAGTLLFAQPGAQIVTESGVSRAAVKGDLLQTGERVLTPAGAILQIVLADGSLVGMRPESELKITPPLAGSGSEAPVLGLISGTARVIGVELMDKKKTSNFTLQSGGATVSLKGADLESTVVKSDAKPAFGGGVTTSPGSYHRLMAGAASVSNGTQIAPLAPQQTSFMRSGNPGAFTVTTPSQNVSVGTPSIYVPPAVVVVPPAAPPAVVNPITPPLPPPLSPLPLPPLPPALLPIAPAPIVKPCTRFIGQTCIQ